MAVIKLIGYDRNESVYDDERKGNPNIQTDILFTGMCGVGGDQKWIANVFPHFYVLNHIQQLYILDFILKLLFQSQFFFSLLSGVRRRKLSHV